MNLSVRTSKLNWITRPVATAVVCSLLMLLPSCRIPELRGPVPGAELPDTFNGRATSDNSAELSVVEFFNDPVLTNLLEEALVNNQQLKILNENIQIANNEILARKGAYLPFFNVGATAGLDKYGTYTLPGASLHDDPFLPGQFLPNPLPNFMLATDVSWQVDIWRRLRNARDAAIFRYFGTIEGRNYVVTRFIAEIAENYYGLMALDRRLEVLDNIIQLQEQSLEMAEKRKEGARGTELPVQRFLAEVRRNQSEKLIVKQEIVEVENKINFLLGRYPMPVERNSANFIDLQMHSLSVGVPSELLQNRPDIREAERELAAAGLDVKVARARFYPALTITGQVGFDAFNPRYLFLSPASLIGSVAGNLVAPVINRAAIKAEYCSANARQLQAVYNYQRVTLEAFTEVINRISMVENYGKSIEIKKQQLESLEAAVDAATKLFQNARIEYLDVLFAQRDLRDARQVLIDTKRQQLSAIVNTYQALGGGCAGLDSDPFLDTAEGVAHTSSPYPSAPPESSPVIVPEPAPPIVPPAAPSVPPAVETIDKIDEKQ